jgi:hypothetical protein
MPILEMTVLAVVANAVVILTFVQSRGGGAIAQRHHQHQTVHGANLL